jgi:hypothetical protein
MNCLVLDLEAVTDSLLPPFEPRNGATDQFAPPPYWQIVCVGVALVEADGALAKWAIIEDGATDEPTILRSTVSAITGRCARGGCAITGWNTRGYDMPVIAARCLRHGIPFHWYYGDNNARRRHKHNDHLDLKDYLSDYGGAWSYGLNIAAKMIGMPGKMETSGNDVAGLFDAGKLDVVRAYCLTDVIQTVAVLQRVLYIRGTISHDQYACAAHSTLDVIRRDERLAHMLPLIDVDRFTLGVAEPPDLTSRDPVQAA